MKKKIKILSGFDGISCARVALERAGYEIEEYYASELDKYAMKVAMANYPDTKQIGDITKVKESDFSWIDFFCGGPPCQGFSFAGKQLNFDDPRSKLLLEFVRILNELKAINPDIKFLLENVKMKKEYQDIISNLLGVQPIEINSALVSAQNRKRLYWTNIGAGGGLIMQPEDRRIFLKDIFNGGEDITNRVLKKPLNTSTYRNTWKNMVSLNDKSKCLTYSGQNISNASCTNINIDNKYYKLTPIECERLQTLPDNYTNHISNSQRYKSIGNGWNIDTIVHILSYDK